MPSAVLVLLMASIICAHGVTLSRPGSGKILNRTVMLPGSTRPLPALGHVACCNPIKMQPAAALAKAVQYLQAGGRLLETAPDYGNEAAIGQAVQKSGVPREEVWIHIAVDDPPFKEMDLRQRTVERIRQSLSRMGLDYLDVVSLHWGPTLVKHSNFTLEDDVEMWRGLLDAKRVGLVRNVGLLMHTRSEIEHLTRVTGVAPQLVLVYISPFHPPEQAEYMRWVQSQGIAMAIYGLFAWFSHYTGIPETEQQMQALQAIGARHSGATFGQVLVRWALDQGVAIITNDPMPDIRQDDLDVLGPGDHLDAEDHRILAAAPRWTCENVPFVQPLSGCFP